MSEFIGCIAKAMWKRIWVAGWKESRIYISPIPCSLNQLALIWIETMGIGALSENSHKSRVDSISASPDVSVVNPVDNDL
jgi:hypothetical protein